MATICEMSDPTVFVAEPAGPDRFLLGEGPVWDPERERLLWVDIENGRVHSGVLDGDRIQPREVVDVGGQVGAAVWAQDGTLLVAAQRGLLTITPDGARSPFATLLPDGRESRLNDGSCDPAGRFLVGSMAMDDRTGEEYLWRVEADGAITTVDDDLTLSNGLGWSPDGTTMYSVDTAANIVWARQYDVRDGSFGARRALFAVSGGDPDGLCVDAEGNLWVAIWGGGEVRCYAPSGQVLSTVRVDRAPHTSCPAFAGPDLDLLVITTARTGLTPEELRSSAAGSGLLYTARVGVSGAPVPYWAGPGTASVG